MQNLTLNPAFKGAIVTSNVEVTHLNQKFHNAYTVCREEVLKMPAVYYMHKGSYLGKVFNEKIDDLKSSGLIDYWISKYLNQRYLHLKKSVAGPRKLSFQELYGTVQLLLLGNFVVITAFAFELIVQKLNRNEK